MSGKQEGMVGNLHPLECFAIACDCISTLCKQQLQTQGAVDQTHLAAAPPENLIQG